ncbi:hypothetical protein DDSR119_36 [Pseudomonas phage DDSR119]|nr:hypothetical protein DDSR119_36 [Pseudomonas phage DDSR119]
MTYEECQERLAKNAELRAKCASMQAEIKEAKEAGPVATLIRAFNAAERDGNLPVRFQIGKFAYGPSIVAHLRRKGMIVSRGLDCWEITGRNPI